jgi:hypothetical protein
VGQVPEGKDPRKVDEKLINRYQLDLSKWARARRKRAGLANLQYLRFGRFFVLLATHGAHTFFEEEAMAIRDAWKTPIRFRGYAISYRNGHPHVRIEQEEYKRLNAYFLDWPRTARPSGWGASWQGCRSSRTRRCAGSCWLYCGPSIGSGSGRGSSRSRRTAFAWCAACAGRSSRTL